MDVDEVVTSKKENGKKKMRVLGMRKIVGEVRFSSF